MRRIHRSDERGIAMVTAILISAVILMLSITAESLAVHNLNGSGGDRKRTQVIAAAEAGIDSTLSLLRSQPANQLPCSVQGTLQTSPQQQYNVAIGYFLQDGTPMSCSSTTGVSSSPYRAVLTSTGSSVPTATSPSVKRTMESEVRLSELFGSLSQAIYSNNTPSIANNSTINGFSGDDANIYTNANFLCANSVNDHGTLFAQGSVTVSQCTFSGDIWANGSVSLSSGAVVKSNVFSSTSNIDLKNSTIQKNATAHTTITKDNPSHILGSQTTGWNGGPPPSQPFVQITYDQQGWMDQGYTPHTDSDCTSAANYIKSLTLAQGKVVEDITASCTLNLSGTINVYNDLAIVSNGGIAPSSVTITSSNGTHKLQLIVAYSTATLAACGTGNYDYNSTTQTTITNLSLFLYTPCTINIYNNAGAGGQLYGGTVNVKNQFTLNFLPFYIPGAGGVSGFNAEVAYKREIVNP